jgi:adenylate kinase family enzyme
MQRVAVVGVSGSGKTTLAAELAQRLGVPHVEIDSLFWGPNWTPAPREVMRARMAQALAGDIWVTDGNYDSLRDLVWPRADTVVWLDYALPLILWRLTRRTLHRLGRRVVLWQGNTESWRTQFFSRDSLYVWALQSYPKLRKRYTGLAEQPAYQHLKVVRLRRPRETETWLASLPEDIRGGS